MARSLPGATSTAGVDWLVGSKTGSQMFDTFKRPLVPSPPFAPDGSVVAWGDPLRGGDCSGVQEQLKEVQAIQAVCGAFAAIRKNGSVVTWG